MLIFSLFCFATCYGQNQLSRKQAWEDIDSLVAKIESVHYNPYLHLSKKVFCQKVEEVKKSIPDSLGFESLLLKMYAITAVLEDGHSMPYLVQPQIKANLAEADFLPFKLVFDKGSAYIKAPEEGLLHGANILSVNGLSTKAAVKEFSALLGGSAYYKKEMAERLFGYFLFLKGIRPPFKITYTTTGKNVNTKTVDKGITFKEALHQSMPHLNNSNSFKLLNTKTAYLDFLSMNGSLDAWGNFLDSAFTSVRKDKVETVLVDIRNNPGGNSVFANYLLAYITRKKFLLASGKCWRISADMKKVQQENGETNPEYQSKENGTNWCREFCEPQENPVVADSVFTGKVYLLTGPFTFSSANMLADAIKTFKLGTVIGTPTGEYTNDFGETLVFSLPHSNIKIQTTTSFEYGANCNRTISETVKPDITITPTLADKLSETDTILLRILKIAGSR